MGRVVRWSVFALVILGAFLLAFTVWNPWRFADDAGDAGLEAASDRYVEAAGLQFRVREEGPRDAPPLVLIHGFSMSLESFDGWAAAFRTDHRVIRFDLPGHGLTGPHPTSRYMNEETVDQIAALFDTLGLEQFAVAGNSLGGLIAWRYAAENPGRVSRMILIAPGGFPLPGVGDEPAEASLFVEAYYRFAPKWMVRNALKTLYGDAEAVTEEQVDRVHRMMRQPGVGSALLQRAEAFTLPDPVPDLGEVTAPVLLIWGARDPMVPVGHADLFDTALPDSKVRIYEDLGHMPHEEAPDRTSLHARTFLEGRSRRRWSSHVAHRRRATARVRAI